MLRLIDLYLYIYYKTASVNPIGYDSPIIGAILLAILPITPIIVKLTTFIFNRYNTIYFIIVAFIFSIILYFLFKSRIHKIKEYEKNASLNKWWVLSFLFIFQSLFTTLISLFVAVHFFKGF